MCRITIKQRKNQWNHFCMKANDMKVIDSRINSYSFFRFFSKNCTQKALWNEWWYFLWKDYWKEKLNYSNYLAENNLCVCFEFARTLYKFRSNWKHFLNVIRACYILTQSNKINDRKMKYSLARPIVSSTYPTGIGNVYKYYQILYIILFKLILM